ncbi:thioredoxin family protein [Arenicellales bacterium IMCC56312]
MKHFLLFHFSTRILSALALLIPLSTTSVFASNELGKFLGAMDSEHPSWFKDSFLDFEEDIAEAATQEKRLVLYFWQTGCPYCNALIEHNFSQRDIVETMNTHYDVVAINIWGDREIIQVGGQTFTEKTLAAALNVNFTPTLLFFNESRDIALRLNGYYPPKELRAALDWAKKSGDSDKTFPEYLANLQGSPDNAQINRQEFFESDLLDISDQAGEPFAIYFEQSNCRQCDILHQKVLTQSLVQNQAKQIKSFQFDMWSNTPVTTVDGRQITVREFAQDLNVQFSPTVIFFDSTGKEVMRMDGAFKTFHTYGIFRYVNEIAYLEEPNFQRYLGALAEQLREKGYDVDIWSYDLAVSQDNKAITLD